MFDSTTTREPLAALARFEAVVDELLDLDRGALCGSEMLALLRGVEQQRRRLASVDALNIAEIESRHLAAENSCRDTAALLVDMLHVDAREARHRAAAARDLGPRVTLHGEPLAPIFPAIAAALERGEISADHARHAMAFFEHIPTDTPLDAIEDLQKRLIEVARQTTPSNLGRFAVQLAAYLNQDGDEPAEEYRQRQRSFALITGPDGWSRATGYFSPELTAVTNSLLDALAAPHPSEDGEPDDRNPGQRRHDAMLDAGLRLVRSSTLPDVGGAPATVLVTITERSLRERVGSAVTSHGDLLPIGDVLRAAADIEVIPVVLNDAGGVVAYGSGRRLASPGQRRALAARDHDCSFPGCTAPPGWCESHHVIPWQEGGGTDLANLTLLCGHHHRQFQRQGWECAMVQGSPRWRPPAWIDPGRELRRNRAHHTEPIFVERISGD